MSSFDLWYYLSTDSIVAPVAPETRVGPLVSGPIMAPVEVRLSSTDLPRGLVAKVFRHPDYRIPVLELEDAFERGWREVLNETGSGSFKIPNASAERDELELDDLVRFELDGRALFTMTVPEDDSETIAPGEEHDEVTTFTGPGHVGLTSEAIVMPARGADAKPIQIDRLFSWPSPEFDDSGWRAATELSTVDDSVGVWPLTFGGTDEHQFPDRTALIVGPSTGSTTSAPVGTCYFRSEVTIGATVKAVLFVGQDNVVDFYVDGQAFLHADDVRLTSSIQLELSAGAHTFAAQVLSGAQLPPAAPTESNPLGLAWALYRADQNGEGVELLAHSTGANTKIVEYPDPPPGMTPGEVISIIFEEAQADDLLEGWTLTFDRDVDSAGNPWPVVGDISTKVGNDYRTFILDELASTYVDVRALPGGLVLEAFIRGSMGIETDVELHPPTDPKDPKTGNLTELGHKRKSATATELLVRWPGGWHLVDATPIGARKKRAVLGLGNAPSIAEVERIARAELAKYALERPSITIGIEPIDDTDRPYVAFVVADRITVPERSLLSGSLERVVALTVAEDENGRIGYAAEIVEVEKTQEERLEITGKKFSDGTLRGDSRVSTPTAQISGAVGPSCCPPAAVDGGGGG